jgi:hypothetical protein
VHNTNARFLASITCGMPIESVLPSHAWKAWIRAALWSIRLLHAFEQGGSKQAYTLLTACQPRQTYGKTYATPLRILKAQEAVHLLRAWIHLMGRPHACFGESFALCAALRCLGFDCHLIVGYAHIEQFVSTPMHAWVEYEGEPVNDSLEVNYAYDPLYRDGYPVGEMNNQP